MLDYTISGALLKICHLSIEVGLHQGIEYLSSLPSTAAARVAASLYNPHHRPGQEVSRLLVTDLGQVKGSGLGLHIVKKIVDKHQGKIEVTSLPKQTTFTVSLPI